VIGVGGNDFRVNLLKPWRLIQDIPQIQERYREIVRQLKSLQGRVQPILVFQYLTDAKNDYYGIYTIFGLLGTKGVAVHLLSMVLLTAPIWTMMGIVSGLGAGIAPGVDALPSEGSSQIA